MFTFQSLDTYIARAKCSCYTDTSLNRPDEELEPVVQAFPVNGDRAAAGEVWKRLTPDVSMRMGLSSQATTVNWHHRSPAPLKELGDKVGREDYGVVWDRGSRDSFFARESVTERARWRGSGSNEGFLEVEAASHVGGGFDGTGAWLGSEDGEN